MPDLWVCASTCVLGALLLLVLGRAVNRERRTVALPAPPGLPLLGHSLTLRAWAPLSWFRSSGGGSGDQRLLAALLRWSEQYDGAFQLRTGWLGRLLLGDPRVVVVLSDPPAAHALLALGEDAAVKPRRYYASLDRVLHPAAAPSSATAGSSPQWLLLRRSLLHAFSISELRQDFEVAKVKALSLARVITDLGPGVVLDVDDAALRFSLDVMGLSKLGYDFQAVEAQGEVLMLRLLEEVSAEWDARRRRLLSWLAPWISDAAAEGQTRCRILHHFIEKELWADIQARGPPPADDVTLAAQLARLRSPPSRGAPALPLQRTLSELATQLLLAHGPTGHCIAWALGCLAANRAAQDRLVAELKREGVFDDPLKLSYDILPKLSYLDCVVREALRLYPTMPFPATVRTLKKDVVLGGGGGAGGLTLAAGSEVWVDVFSMHRSPRLWRDPNRFIPDRWMAEVEAAAAASQRQPQGKQQQGSQPQDGEPPGDATAEATATAPRRYDGLCTVEPDPDAEGGAAAAQPPPPAAAAAVAAAEPPLCSPDAFMPFGSGPRSCLGQRLAVAEVKAALAVLLSFLVFEPSGEDDAGAGAGGGGEAGEVAQMGLGLFLRPVGGLHLLVAPRKRRT
ncbi:hypothetical protein PLESTB_001002400 [Pleodorina starrii]|uniref:Cytochrome P450 n=1 Tax=Pleodorina starrii TaxID=330485 RepID=A0A9W6BP76_9CHLO|nr:hypothetical protein PLESTM_001205000 [Pleodorina starrii]GLC55578.1 hypothetical protein PLESTB_001002400 [Pleodorina starrii]